MNQPTRIMDDAEFAEYFEDYALRVENFYEVAYWHFSDAVIQEIVARHVRPGPGTRLLDAGGGTGRWAEWYVERFDVDVTIADKSSAMLAQARARAVGAGLQGRIDTVETDLESDVDITPESFDFITGTYGVLSFVNDPEAFLSNLYRLLRPGGRMMMMCHSLSTAMETKMTAEGPAAAQDVARARCVKWANDVPLLRVFDSAELRILAEKCGFRAPRVFGVTNVLRPGPEDFGYPYTETSHASRLLEDPAYFAGALQVELMAAERQEWSDRGTNLLLIAERQP